MKTSLGPCHWTCHATPVPIQFRIIFKYFNRKSFTWFSLLTQFQSLQCSFHKLVLFFKFFRFFENWLQLLIVSDKFSGGGQGYFFITYLRILIIFMSLSCKRCTITEKRKRTMEEKLIKVLKTILYYIIMQVIIVDIKYKA